MLNLFVTPLVLMLSLQQPSTPAPDDLSFRLTVRNVSDADLTVRTTELPEGAIIPAGKDGTVQVKSPRSMVQGRVRIVLTQPAVDGHVAATFSVTGFDADAIVLWGDSEQIIAAAGPAPDAHEGTNLAAMLSAIVAVPESTADQSLHLLLGVPIALDAGTSRCFLRPCLIVGRFGLEYASVLGARFSWVSPGNAKLGRANGYPFEAVTSFDLRHGFWIGQTEWTDFEDLLARVLSGKIGIVDALKDRAAMAASGDMPSASEWHEAVAISRVIAESDGLAWTLPSEAQWEYACRLQSNGRYAQAADGRMLTESEFWYNQTGRGEVRPVGVLVPSVLGLYDLHGNRLEWCRDAFKKRIDVSGATADQQIEAMAHTRAMRGGHVGSPAAACECGARWDAGPERGAVSVVGVRRVIETPIPADPTQPHQEQP